MRCCLLLGILFASTVQAQTAVERVELTPFAGYLFGGTFITFTPPPANIPSLKIADHFAFGFRAGYNLTPSLEPEIQWSRAETNLTSRPAPDPLTLDFLIAGLTYNFSSAGFRPYLSLGLGVGLFDKAFLKTQTLFTLSAAVGAKYLFTRHVGVRLEFRGYGSQRTDRIKAECPSCPNNWIFNGDLTGGLVVAF